MPRKISSGTAATLGAVTIGLLAGAISFGLFPLTHGADFAQFHYHARTWLAGRDPYSGGFPIMRATRVVPEPFFYPFPTLLALAPFAYLPLRFALAAFTTTSSTILSYAVIRRAPHQLPMFFGAGYIVALGLGQWTPIVAATFVLPAIAWLAVLKPNVGLAVTAAKPSWPAIVGGGGLLLATLVIQPSWPAEWLRNLHSMPGHPIPLSMPGGFLLLTALLRWRRPEARLIVAMACVPQLMYFADQLPLWLIPRTRRESVVLSASSMVAWLLTLELNTNAGRQAAFASDMFVLIGIYLPALAMVIRRPNEGALPQRVEQSLSWLPRWAAGTPAPASDSSAHA